MSEEKKLFEKLLNVQKELKAPKAHFNSFGKYKYRSAEDILESVKPLNAENELLLTITDEPLLVGDWHYIKATATITDGVETHTVTAYARESLTKKGMDESQITGTASSYARKYALNGLYLIDDTKDADTDEYQNQNNKSKTNNSAPMITAEQRKELVTNINWLVENRGETQEKWIQALGVSELNKLTESQAKEAIEKVNNWVEQAKKSA
ncbi:ERF family protein [Salibacterium lacus]|uniref:ERF family protein n=1 Tax=Salibacterium lacus TaxID=1898109 RepID=A0ABW5SWP6_9BACI